MARNRPPSAGSQPLVPFRSATATLMLGNGTPSTVTVAQPLETPAPAAGTVPIRPRRRNTATPPTLVVTLTVLAEQLRLTPGNDWLSASFISFAPTQPD